MLPPVFETLNTLAIREYIGKTGHVRLYDFGDAPEKVAKPYIVFQTISNSPHEQLSGAPCGDLNSVQIDIYAGPQNNAKSEIRELAKLVRDALDDAGIANRLIIQSREPETKLYRVSIEADFITNR